jgi:NADH:ubiquinone oxidoreductase subunit D
MILYISCTFSSRIDEIVGITIRKSYTKQRLVDIGVVRYLKHKHGVFWSYVRGSGLPWI